MAKSKYAPLGSYLKAQPFTHVPMTFEEIERVIGFPLPPVAKGNRAWWSNNPTNNVMTTVWTDAGFKTEQVDMAGRKLVFSRAGRNTAPSRSSARPAAPSGGRSGQPLQLFGCLKGTVTLAQGHDLTSPADPAWGAAER